MSEEKTSSQPIFDRRSADLLFGRILPSLISAALIWTLTQLQALMTRTTEITIEMRYVQMQLAKIQDSQYPRGDVEKELARMDKTLEHQSARIAKLEQSK